MVQEEWKEIEGTNGLYRISNLGRVWSVRFNRQVKHTETKLGYPVITIPVLEKKQQFMHRLIAKAFIPNPYGLPVVNHIDGNRANFSIKNLEWCTQSHNVKAEYLSGRRIGKTNMKGRFGELNPASRPVAKFSLDGTLLRVFPCLAQAADFVGGSASHIVKVCKGKLKKHKGYQWRYM